MPKVLLIDHVWDGSLRCPHCSETNKVPKQGFKCGCRSCTICWVRYGNDLYWEEDPGDLMILIQKNRKAEEYRASTAFVNNVPLNVSIYAPGVDYSNEPYIKEENRVRYSNKKLDKIMERYYNRNKKSKENKPNANGDIFPRFPLIGIF